MSKDAKKAPEAVLPVKEQKVPLKPKTVKTVNIGHSYTYILTTPEQRKAIDLLKYKIKLEKIIKDFFGEDLISVSILKDRYTLILNIPYEVGAKRRLGRLISDNSGLKEYVRTIEYNNTKDKSGQLFKMLNVEDTK